MSSSFLKLSGVGIGTFLILVLPLYADAQAVQRTRVGDLEAPLELGTITGQQLKDKGCVVKDRIDVEGASTAIDLVDRPVGWRYVYPADISDYIDDSIGIDFEHPVFFFCEPGVVSKDLAPDEDADDGWLGEKTLVRWAIMEIARAVAQVGLWVLALGGALLGWSLGIRNYASSDIVQNGWPFVQGIANLGFIVALLAIALLMTLRIEVGGGVKRLLPRLFIAALLINFSLLFGEIIIDSTRLLMAIMMRAITGSRGVTFVNLGTEIVRGSDLLNELFHIGTAGPIPGFAWKETVATNDQNVLRSIQAAILVWAVAISVFFIAAALIVRFIILLILLIASPAAYLGMAIPGAKQLTDKWWSNFLKWAFFGPISLFFLLLLIRTTNSSIVSTGVKPGALEGGIIPIIFTVVMSVIAVIGGFQLGGVGSAATMNAIKKGTGKMGRGAYIATGARGGVRQVRDFSRELKSDVAKSARSGKMFGEGRGQAARSSASWVARFVAGPKRNADGTLAKGETSMGTRAGSAIARRLPSGAGDRESIAAARKIVSNKSSRSNLREATRTEEAAKKAEASGDTAGAQSLRDQAQVHRDAGLGALLKQAGLDRNNPADQGKIIAKLSDSNFILNVPPEALKGFMEHGTDGEKNAVGAALATADMSAVTPNKRKEVIKAVVDSGNTQILKTVVNNVDFVEHMGGSDKAKVFQLDDQALTTRLVRTMRTAEQRKK
ncbi:MAG: hypothetical protein WD200_00975 [Candidatus Andersenbacteria bacterium]